MNPKIVLLFSLISLISLSCSQKLRNHVDAVALECGLPRNFPADDFQILTLTSPNTISDKKDLQILTVDSHQAVHTVDFDLTPKQCLLIKRQDIQGAHHIALIVKNRQAAEVQALDGETLSAPLDLKDCGKYCQAFPICGLMPEAKDSDRNFAIFRPEAYNGFVNVSLEADFTSRPLQVNDRGCFALPVDGKGLLKIQDSAGNFYEDKAENLLGRSSRNPLSVASVALRGPLTADEKMCRQDSMHYHIAGGKCVPNSFRQYCENAPSHIGVVTFASFFVRRDCEKIDDFLKSQTSLDFFYKNLADVGVFSGLDNLISLNLSGNKFSSFASLYGTTNVETLVLSANGVPFDISSLARFTHLKSLDITQTTFINMDKLPVMEQLEELHVSGADPQLLAKFPHLKRLSITSVKNLDFSVIPNAELEVLSITSADNLNHMKSLSRLRHLRELSFGFVDAIEDGSELPYLPELQSLSLGYMPYPDMMALATIETLQSLRIESNRYPLPKNMPRLEHLTSLSSADDVSTDLNWLSLLPNLRELTLSGNIDTLATLPTMPNVETLDATGMGIKSLEALVRLPKLKTLLLLENATDLDFSTLPFMPNLERFEYNSNDDVASSSLDWIKNLPNLRTFTLKYNSDQDIGKFLPQSVEDLTLLSVNAKDLRFLSGLPSLSSLTLRLATLEPFLVDPREVQPLDYLKLEISSAQLGNLPTFSSVDYLRVESNDWEADDANLANLGQKVLKAQTLDLQGGVIGPIALMGFTGLEHLILKAGIANWPSFPQLPNLETLFLDSSMLESLAGIEKFPNLKVLEFAGGNKVKTLEPLLQLEKLEEIKDSRKLRGQFIDENTCPETDEAPKGLREYCRNLQMIFRTPFGPLPF